MLNFAFNVLFQTQVPMKTQFSGTGLGLFNEKKNLGKYFVFGSPKKNTFSNDFSLKKKNHRKKSWVAVFGPGGGFLGVGTSELVVIGVVAWLVLGPKRLYQLARDIGKISGEIKNVAEEARQTFQQAIDVESGDLSSLSPKKSSGTSNPPEEISKPRSSNLDDLVNNEISTLEGKNKKN